MISFILSPLSFLIIFIWVLFFFMNLDKGLSILSFLKISPLFHWSFLLFSYSLFHLFLLSYLLFPFLYELWTYFIHLFLVPWGVILVVLSDISVTIIAFFGLPFAWNILFHFFTFSLGVSLKLIWVSHRPPFSHSVSLIREFNPSTYI